MSIRDEVLAANDEYAADFGSKGGLAFPPAGYIYDVSTGRLVEVPAATAAGKAA